MPAWMTSTPPDDDGNDEAAGRHRPWDWKRCVRKKNPSVILSDENERLVGEWLEQEAEFIYNKGMTAYKDKARVCRAFEEKGRSLAPPVSGPELRTWFTSLRTRFGRLTAEKSGQGASRRLTDREKWILNIFHFLKPHIVRQKKPKVLGLPMSASAAVACSNPPGHGPALDVPALCDPAGSATPVPCSSDDRSSTIDDPAPQRKSRKEDKAGSGVLDVLLQQAESARHMLQGAIRPLCDPRLVYWRNSLEELAADCADVGPELRMALKVEFISAIQRFVRATKEGITRPPHHLIPHTQAEALWDGLPAAPVPLPAPATYVPLATPSGAMAQPLNLTAQQVAMLHAQLSAPAVASTPRDLNVSLPTSSFLENL
ncbi:uncharacterized protein [Macrobrachium rosenbergii]|uniref:uncharacterized protein n=1 Tax=Macrobrachium rosenbergii TaxID=79674 RepID=UPI0034D78B60